MSRAVTMAFCGVMIVVGVAEAQTGYLGLEGGGNVATFAGTDAAGVSSKTGFAVGGLALVRAGSVFAFRPEILFSQQGAQETVSGVQAAIRLNYVEVPLLADVIIPVRNSGVLPSLYAGPVIDLQLSCKASAASGGVSASYACNDSQIGFKTKSATFGLTFGGGLGVPAGRGLVTIDARYKFGLNSIDDTGSNIDLKNRAFTALVGYAFPIGPAGGTH